MSHLVLVGEIRRLKESARSHEEYAERERDGLERRLLTTQSEFEVALRRERRLREEEREQAQRDKVC